MLRVSSAPYELMRSPGPSASQDHGRSVIVSHIRRSVLRNEECVRCYFIPWVFLLGQQNFEAEMRLSYGWDGQTRHEDCNSVRKSKVAK